MKVLQVITRFNPKHGGAVDVVSNISRFLVQRGHEVSIATTSYEFDDKFAELIRNDGVKVIPFKYFFNYCKFIPSPSMKKWAKENIANYDVIHLHDTRSYQNNVVCKYAEKYNVPYVMQAHGGILRIISRKTLKIAYDSCWGNEIYKKASKFIALSESEKKAYQIAGIDINKVKIIPNGIDISKFKNLPEKGKFRKKYLLDNDKIILYIGRLDKSKGIDLILEMFAKLLLNREDCRLIIIGTDDGYGETIKTKIDSLNINKKILFTGFITNEEKLMALVDGDVFITPRFDGFPIIFLEAWACGLPVITTNEGDSLPWINGYLGIVTDYESNQLATAVSEILSNQEKKRILGDNGRAIIREELNWEKIIKSIEAIYEECVTI